MNGTIGTLQGFGSTECATRFMLLYDNASGDWQGLSRSSQAPRYATIAELLKRWSADRNVLDVGCGEGVLRGWLPRDGNYTGIEPSALAIRTAVRLNPAAQFINSHAERFKGSANRFSAVVFNEMLYYSHDPVGLVRKYAALVDAGGVILCSIFQRPGSTSLKARLWSMLDRRRPSSNIHCEQMVRNYMAKQLWPILDDRCVQAEGSSGMWHIWVAKPE